MNRQVRDVLEISPNRVFGKITFDAKMVLPP